MAEEANPAAAWRGAAAGGDLLVLSRVRRLRRRRRCRAAATTAPTSHRAHDVVPGEGRGGGAAAPDRRPE